MEGDSISAILLICIHDISLFLKTNDVDQLGLVSMAYHSAIKINWEDRFEELYPVQYLDIGGKSIENEKHIDWMVLCLLEEKSTLSSVSLTYGLYTSKNKYIEEDISWGEALVNIFSYHVQRRLKIFTDSVDIPNNVREEEKPLEILKFWLHRIDITEKLLSQIGEKKKIYSEIINVLKVNQSPKIDHLERNIGLVSKLRNEASWNAKYFQVLQKPFETIAYGSLQEAGYVLPSMIKTLKLIWKSSKYYKNAERMEDTLGIIALAIGNKVTRALKLDNLLHAKDLSKEIKQVDYAGQMLDRWHDVYHNSNDEWGPFDEYILFHEIDSFAQRCSEIREILSTLNHFHNDILPSLNGLDTEKGKKKMHLIEKKIDDLVAQMEDHLMIPTKSVFRIAAERFDLFDSANLPSWKTILEKFRKEKMEIIGIAHDLRQE